MSWPTSEEQSSEPSVRMMMGCERCTLERGQDGRHDGNVGSHEEETAEPHHAEYWQPLHQEVHSHSKVLVLCNKAIVMTSVPTCLTPRDSCLTAKRMLPYPRNSKSLN